MFQAFRACQMVMTPMSRAQSPKTMLVIVPEDAEDRDVEENLGDCRGIGSSGSECVRGG